MKGVFLHDAEGTAHEFMFDPELGDTVIGERVAKLEHDGAVQDRLRMLAGLSFVVGWVALLIVLAIMTYAPLAVVLSIGVIAPIGLLGCPLLNIWADHLAELSGKRRQAWVDAGEAVDIDFRRAFKRAKVSATDVWRAARLYADAEETARRARKASRLRRSNRLSPGAEPALDAAISASAQRYREVASILDPGGKRTEKWLLAKASPALT